MHGVCVEMNTWVTKLLVLSNILLLVGIIVVVGWNAQVNFLDVPDYQAYIVNTFKDGRFVGHSFPVLPIHTVRGDTLRTDFSATKAGVVFVFDEFYCKPCLELVLNGLQHIHDNIEDPVQLPIYVVSNSDLGTLSQYRRAFGLKFDLGYTIQGGDVSHERMFERTPMVYLIDSNNRILKCHHPLSQREQFTELFFSELVFNYLPTLKINTTGFKDSPLKNLNGMPLVEIILGQHPVKDEF